jgi:hypothetical protein
LFFIFIQGKESAAMKADLLRARNMKRYINQLTVAKKQCEKRIRILGGPAYDQQDDGVLDEAEGPQSQKVHAQLSKFLVLTLGTFHNSKLIYLVVRFKRLFLGAIDFCEW